MVLPGCKAADLELNPLTKQVTCGGQPVTLTARELALPKVLLRHKNEVLSRANLKDAGLVLLNVPFAITGGYLTPFIFPWFLSARTGSTGGTSRRQSRHPARF